MKTLTFRKLILLVVLISGCCVLFGEISPGKEIKKEIKFVPDPIKGLYAYHTNGDLDFMMNGPHVVVRADLNITEESSIGLTLYLCAKETKHDWTTYESTWHMIIPVFGYTIEKITSAPSSSAEYTDSNDDLDSPRVEGKLVQSFEIMGDSPGKDYPYLNVYFNEIIVKATESTDFGLKTGDIICLSADNYSYLSRIANQICAIKSQIEFDQYCKFYVTVLDNSTRTIALLADKESNKYLSRTSSGDIQAVKSQIDDSCKFQVTVLGYNTIALKADNAQYLSRNTSSQVIEASKSQIDPFCKFKVTIFR